jgi:hypothetical protein
VRASRTSQPYKAGAAARGPGPALQAMLRGASLTGNPGNRMRPAVKRAGSLQRALRGR